MARYHGRHVRTEGLLRLDSASYSRDLAHSRRRLLRGATLVAAGAAGAGSVLVVGAGAAHAAAGDELKQNAANDAGAAATTVTATLTAATLVLRNTSGPALRLAPTPIASIPLTGAPLGTLAVDPQGNLAISGTDYGSGTVTGWAYSTAWASMTVPTQPKRVLDTRNAAGRANIVAGASGIDSSGRLLAGKTLQIKLAGATKPEAVCANVTIAKPASGGYVTVWNSGVRPNASSVNWWEAGQVLSNFVEAPVGSDGTILVYAAATTAVIIDVCGFVVADRAQVLVP